MHINKVISFLNSWRTANEEFHSQLTDVQAALETFHGSFLMNARPNEPPRRPWEDALEPLGWERSVGVRFSDETRVSFVSLGPVKDGVSAIPSTTFDILGRWLFQRGSLAVRLGVIRLPILVLPTSEYARNLSNRIISRTPFELIESQLVALAPLSHTSPFLILGYSDAPRGKEPQVHELAPYFSEQNRLFERCIEFPPEYHQAGIGILNFFGTYLSKRYPQADAVVRIEQEGLTVRLIIQGRDGAREVIEKALQEYELIVSQKAPPEAVVNNQQLIFELRQELRIAQVRIEGQRDILALQEARMDQLLNIIGAGLAKPAPVTIDFKPTIGITNTQANQMISGAIDALEDLKELLPASGAAQVPVEDLQQALEAVERETDAVRIRESGVLSRFRAFLDKASDGAGDFKTLLEATDQGLETLQRLAAKYNRIAEWCGLPQVPSMFTK